MPPTQCSFESTPGVSDCHVAPAGHPEGYPPSNIPTEGSSAPSATLPEMSSSAVAVDPVMQPLMIQTEMLPPVPPHQQYMWVQNAPGHMMQIPQSQAPYAFQFPNHGTSWLNVGSQSFQPIGGVGGLGDSGSSTPVHFEQHDNDNGGGRVRRSSDRNVLYLSSSAGSSAAASPGHFSAQQQPYTTSIPIPFGASSHPATMMTYGPPPQDVQCSTYSPPSSYSFPALQYATPPMQFQHGTPPPHQITTAVPTEGFVYNRPPPTAAAGSPMMMMMSGATQCQPQHYSVSSPLPTPQFSAAAVSPGPAPAPGSSMYVITPPYYSSPAHTPAPIPATTVPALPQIERLNLNNVPMYRPAPAQNLSQPSDMAAIWHREFTSKFGKFQHKWDLVPAPEGPAYDAQGIFEDTAKIRFVCKNCRHAWTSMQGKVKFWYKLDVGQQRGSVHFQLFGQKCKTCREKRGVDEIQDALWYPDEIAKVVHNIHAKVGMIYYNIACPQIMIQRRMGQPKGQHDADLCDACSKGICRRSSPNPNLHAWS